MHVLLRLQCQMDDSCLQGRVNLLFIAWCFGVNREYAKKPNKKMVMAVRDDYITRVDQWTTMRSSPLFKAARGSKPNRENWHLLLNHLALDDRKSGIWKLTDLEQIILPASHLWNGGRVRETAFPMSWTVNQEMTLLSTIDSLTLTHVKLVFLCQ